LQGAVFFIKGVVFFSKTFNFFQKWTICSKKAHFTLKNEIVCQKTYKLPLKMKMVAWKRTRWLKKVDCLPENEQVAP